jgi:leader peptidase (prepilin peptidase)/N-methyltransferase
MVTAALLSSIFGLVIGSFLNVVIARVPAGESVVHPGSHCPHCGTALRPVDNIPLVSWLALRAKCRTCRAPIGVRYPLVESGTAALFALLAAKVGPHADLPAHLLIAAGFVALAVVDLDTQRLPNAVVYPTWWLGLAGFVAAAIVDDRTGDLGRALAGAGIGVTVFGAVHAVRPDGMGRGDVRLAAVCGLLLGWNGLADVALGLYGGFVLGAFAAVPLLVAGRAGRRTALPFGPCMIAAALVQVLLGGPLADAVRDRF